MNLQSLPHNGAATMCTFDREFEPTDLAAVSSSCRAGVCSPILAAVNLLNVGVLIVDGECRITFANDYATEVLRSSKGTLIRNTRSAERVHNLSPFSKRLREAISCGDDQLDRFLVFSGADTDCLIVQIVPYRSDEPGQAGASGSILFVSGATATSNLDVRPTATLYGLTRAELRLLEALLNGEKVGDYAKRRGVTLNTVKGHLTQLFRKTQTSRQSELVLRVFANPVFRLASRHSSTRSTSQGSAL
jgi:DNA-binding CsgD family transcriptional regulator